MIINSYFARTSADRSSSDGHAARVSVGYRGRSLNTTALYKQVSEGFDPGIGFVRRRNFEQLYGTLGIHARPTIPGVQELVPFIEADYYYDPDGTPQSHELVAGVEVQFQPDGQIELELRDHFDRLERSFAPYAGRTIPAGTYSFRDARVSYSSTQRFPVYVNLSLTAGDFYDGTRSALGMGLTWRPRYDLSFEGSYQRNAVELASGPFRADLAGLRIKYAWSTTLFGSAFTQYNTQSHTFVTNGRIAWRYSPFSDVFLVYTERVNTELHQRNERSIALKVTRMVAF
jgi:hypothetical protein